MEEIYVLKQKDEKITMEKWDSEIPPIMKCGHQAQSTYYIANRKIWCCAICFGINRIDCVIIQEQVNYEGKFECLNNCGSFAEYNKDKCKWIVHLSKKGGWSGSNPGSVGEADMLPFLDLNNKTFYCGCKE